MLAPAPVNLSQPIYQAHGAVIIHAGVDVILVSFELALDWQIAKEVCSSSQHEGRPDLVATPHALEVAGPRVNNGDRALCQAHRLLERAGCWIIPLIAGIHVDPIRRNPF